jgi:peroxiredoxin
MKIRRWIPLLIITLFLATGIWLAFKDYHPSPKEGTFAPEFSLFDRSHQKKSLIDYRGKVVLLNFWATWCVPCVEEMGSLEQLSRQFKGKNFEVIAISLDEGGWSAIDRFLSKIPVSFTILLDADFKVADQYGTYRVPETYLINSKGQIVDKILGAHNWIERAMVEKIEKLMEENH